MRTSGSLQWLRFGDNLEAPAGNAAQRNQRSLQESAWYIGHETELLVVAQMKFELVIILKTEEQIGVTVAPEVLARANKVIR